MYDDPDQLVKLSRCKFCREVMPPEKVLTHASDVHNVSMPDYYTALSAEVPTVESAKYFSPCTNQGGQMRL
jgi:hypothetical protein